MNSAVATSVTRHTQSHCTGTQMGERMQVKLGVHMATQGGLLIGSPLGALRFVDR